jgi:hypothetical protein
VRRDLLVGIAIGAGLSSAAYVVAGELKPPPPKPSAKVRLYELGYQRPRSPEFGDFEGIPDPLPGKEPTQALAELAHSCGVQEYKLDGGNASAFLYMDPRRLSDEAFNCLGEHVRPPYLSLHMFERCRSLMERSAGNPPCQEPIP